MIVRNNRGTSGFDNSGRGYYFANKQAQSPHQSNQHTQPQPLRPSMHNPSQNSPQSPPQRPKQHQQHNHNSQTHDSTAPSINGNKGYTDTNTQHKDTDTERYVTYTIH